MERAIDNVRVSAGPTEIPPLVETITRLAERHANGVLHLGERGEIWFSGGRIALAVGPSSPDLAEVLVDAGLGTEPELRSLIEGRRSDDAEHQGHGHAPGLARRLAERPDTHHRVERILHEFRLNALFEMLVPGEVITAFDEDAPHPLGPEVAEHAVELTEKATRRIEVWRRIAARIPTTASVFRLAPELPRTLDARVVTDDEWRYLARLDGTNSVADVITDTGDSAFRVCSVLYRFLLEEVIEECEESVPVR
ncbi:MAG: hypothetical protein AAGD35_20775 [Actinomycetota bacterium]